MESAPEAYTGQGSYVFVAYSRHDSEIVFKEIRHLQQLGINVAYDEGIRPGSFWTDEIAKRIQNCDRFLLFVSPDSVCSEHCRRELDFAIEEHRRILAIHLYQTSVPAGLRLSISNRQAIMRFELDESAYQRKLMMFLKDIDTPSNTFTARPTESQHFHIGVFEDSEQTKAKLQALDVPIVRYVSWQGGVFRAHAMRSLAEQFENRIDFQIKVNVREDQEVQIGWEVTSRTDGEVIWANHETETAEDFKLKHEQIAEMIGEGALKMISDYERGRIADLDISELTFKELIVRAEQLNYLDSEQVQDRLEALSRAIEIEPTSGLPHAAMAGILSWKIINGVSSDHDADQARMLSESRQALRLAENDPAVLLSVGTAYCRIGRYQSGLTLIRRAFRMAPTMVARDQLARSLCFAGEPEEAIKLFQEILANLPAGMSFPYVRLAVALAQTGQLQEAVRYSAESVVNFPDDYYGWFVHANLLSQLDDESAATEALADGLRLVPQLKLETIIQQTASTYGRTDEQRDWLTKGLKNLLDRR